VSGFYNSFSGVSVKMRAFLSMCFWLSTFLGGTVAQALAAWHLNFGDGIVYQESSTGELHYTIDTGSGPGASGFTTWQRLPLTIQPKTSTGLAVTGFVGGDNNIYVRKILPSHPRSLYWPAVYMNLISTILARGVLHLHRG
jgi:hypothetical protein